MTYRATLTPSSELLPTLEGLAPRIVGLHPIRIQCDGCKGIHEGGRPSLFINPQNFCLNCNQKEA